MFHRESQIKQEPIAVEKGQERPKPPHGGKGLILAESRII